MLRVCDLYYNRDVSQSDIASVMGISRPTVARLLQSAKQKEIVKIIICDPQERRHSELERKLEKLYRLREVIVVDTIKEEQQQKDALGKATAGYLKSVMKDGFVIGVAMGTTLRYIAPYATKQFQKLMFVPLIGGSGDIDITLHANQVVELLSKAYGGESTHLYAPAMVSRVQTKRELLKDESVSRVTDMYNRLDVAVMGIGTGDLSSTVLRSGYYSEEMKECVRSLGICGDICMQLFDRTGNLDLVEYNKHVIGIHPTKLKQIPYAIGVAGGVHKAEALYGSMQGKFINVLVTDQECAEKLCQMAQEEG